MHELLRILVRGLVSEPAQVRIRERAEPGRIVLELSVAPDDCGRVIGREGRTARALRTLLEALARRRGSSCTLEILD